MSRPHSWDFLPFLPILASQEEKSCVVAFIFFLVQSCPLFLKGLDHDGHEWPLVWHQAEPAPLFAH